MPKNNTHQTPGLVHATHFFECACGKKYSGSEKSVEYRRRLHKKLNPKCKNNKKIFHGEFHGDFTSSENQSYNDQAHDIQKLIMYARQK